MMRYQHGLSPDQNFSQFSSGDGGGVPNSPPQWKNSPAGGGGDGGGGGGGGGDVLLQWGHRKRSRCWRTESRATDESSSTTTTTTSSTQFQAMKRVHRRVVMVDKHNNLPTATTKASKIANANTMPPPSSPSPPSIPCSASNGRSGNLKPPSSKDATAFPSNRRNSEERSGSGNGSPASNSGGRGRGAAASRSKVGKRSPIDHMKVTPSSGSGSAVALRDDKLKNGCVLNLVQEAGIGMNNGPIDSAPPQLGHEAAASFSILDHDHSTAKTATVAGGGEKVGGGGGGGAEGNEWPRICIPLSRKEKEEDFLAMKGTKLPHRPKKRPKAIDRVLQYCFPGMWLPEVARARYEVKEKKCAKKQKRRGLKGMESMDSDSD